MIEEKSEEKFNNALIENRMPSFDLPVEIVAVPSLSPAVAEEEKKGDASESSSSSDSDFDMLEAFDKS